jgi:hypothetical protein
MKVQRIVITHLRAIGCGGRPITIAIVRRPSPCGGKWRYYLVGTTKAEQHSCTKHTDSAAEFHIIASLFWRGGFGGRSIVANLRQ